MIITSQNNAPISNYGGGFRCKSEYPWCIIEFSKKLRKTKKKMTEKREFLRKTIPHNSNIDKNFLGNLDYRGSYQYSAFIKTVPIFRLPRLTTYRLQFELLVDAESQALKQLLCCDEFYVKLGIYPRIKKKSKENVKIIEKPRNNRAETENTALSSIETAALENRDACLRYDDVGKWIVRLTEWVTDERKITPNVEGKVTDLLRQSESNDTTVYVKTDTSNNNKKKKTRYNDSHWLLR
ncbi:Uncharacterized protein FWK35_00030597, partial [Aphis craccivora]